MAEPDFKGAFGSLLDMGPQGWTPKAPQLKPLPSPSRKTSGCSTGSMPTRLDPLEKALLAFIAEETGDARALTPPRLIAS